MVVPTGNSVVEPEFYQMAPEGVSIHANRVALKDVTRDSLLAMEHDTARSAAGIATVRVGVITFACTSGSFVGGPGYDDNDRAEAIFISCTGFRTIEHIAKLESDLGKPVITSNQATFAESLRILGVNEVAPGYGSLFDHYLEGGDPPHPVKIAAE